jgi:dienelactone hydrolase
MRPVTAVDLPVLRMIPVARAIRRAVGGSGIAVWRHRFAVRGWNGDQASPAGDLSRLLDDMQARYDGVRVLVAGHSMGARAAFRVAGHPAVFAVAGLAPWLPPGEPAGQLAGRRVLLAHGSADTVTSPDDTWAYARRARAMTSVTALEIRGGDHAMLRRAGLWHAIAAEFARLSFGLPAGPGPAAAAVRPAATGTPARITLA